MNKVWVTVGVLSVIAVAVIVARSQRNENTADRPDTSTSVPAAQSTQAPTTAAPPATAQGPAATDPAPEPEPLPEEPKETFRVDANGKLILDEPTRLKLEEFFAQTDAKDVDRAAQQLIQHLPSAAAAQALDVVDRYRNYQAAQDQNYVDDAPASPEDAIVQLESLHRLRAEQFGPDLAKAFYADEERLARELIELMRLEKDQSLTMEEKADRAQRLHDTLPSVRAADKGERPPRD